MSKKEYNTVTVGTMWMNENSKTKELFASVSLVQPEDEKGKKNKYCKGRMIYEDFETGNIYEVHQLKRFDNDGHENILGDLCVELNDEEYSTLITGDEE